MEELKKETEVDEETEQPDIDEIFLEDDEVKALTAPEGQPLSTALKNLDKPGYFIKLRRRDYEWKVSARKTYGKILIGLLIAQNIAIFTLVFWSFFSGKLKDLQTVFSILVPATLGETAFMVKTIVEWLFKDINYPE